MAIRAERGLAVRDMAVAANQVCLAAQRLRAEGVSCWKRRECRDGGEVAALGPQAAGGDLRSKIGLPNSTIASRASSESASPSLPSSPSHAAFVSLDKGFLHRGNADAQAR